MYNIARCQLVLGSPKTAARAVFTVVLTVDLSPDRHTTQSAYSLDTSMILSTLTAATECRIDVYPSPKARNIATDFSIGFSCSQSNI